MKTLKQFCRDISPFNNRTEMPAALYMVKKLLAFLFLYLAAAAAGGITVTLILIVTGMDSGIFPEVLQYYGFAFFLAGAVLYWKRIERRPLREMGFGIPGVEFLKGAAIAAVLLAVLFAAGLWSSQFSFDGIATDLGRGSFSFEGSETAESTTAATGSGLWLRLFLLAGGILIQSAAEEALCRGFLLHALMKKLSAPVAAVVSATAFMLPHLASLLEADRSFAAVGIVNLYLISFLLSALVLQRKNLWIACGLHFGWNFLLQEVLGMTLSGQEVGQAGVLIFTVERANIWNGGSYGIEAGLLTAVVLGAGIAAAAEKRKIEKCAR